LSLSQRLGSDFIPEVAVEKSIQATNEARVKFVGQSQIFAQSIFQKPAADEIRLGPMAASGRWPDLMETSILHLNNNLQVLNRPLG